MTTKSELFAYIKEKFDTAPEYPFAKFKDTAIFRHQGNRKWFAATIQVSREKLGLSGEGDCEVVDLKCDPVLSYTFRGLPGILPGYHMNKEHWISVLLDGTVENEMVWSLVDLSYDLTAPKRNKKTKEACLQKQVVKEKEKK